MVEMPACETRITRVGDVVTIHVTAPPAFADSVVLLAEKAREKRITQMYCKVGIPRKPRTTGAESQNHAIWGYATQISQVTGDDPRDVVTEAKRRAMGQGYPYHLDSFGNVIPTSEKDLDTVQAAMLIDELVRIASFVGCVLKETGGDAR